MFAQPLPLESLSVVGLPMPLKGMAATAWDVTVVDGSRNGLTGVTLLAKTGKHAPVSLT